LLFIFHKKDSRFSSVYYERGLYMVINDFFLLIVDVLNQCPAEFIAFAMIIYCALSIFFLHLAFGKTGLFVYFGMSLIVSNVLFLKLVKFSFYTSPIPLGKIVIGSTMFCTSLLTEFYGKETAKKAIYIGITAELIVHFLMLLAVGAQPYVDADSSIYDAGHAQIKALFLPTFSIFISGIIAYLISQYVEIKTFLVVKEMSNSRFLWLRAGLSMCVASLVDNIIFGTLACIVFAPNPVSWNTAFFTYILGSYLARCMICIIFVPWMYLVFNFRINNFFSKRYQDG